MLAGEQGFDRATCGSRAGCGSATCRRTWRSRAGSRWRVRGQQRAGAGRARRAAGRGGGRPGGGAGGERRGRGGGARAADGRRGAAGGHPRARGALRHALHGARGAADPRGARVPGQRLGARPGRSSRAAGRCGRCWRRCCSSSRTCCCSTSRPTTSICRRWRGSRLPQALPAGVRAGVARPRILERADLAGGGVRAGGGAHVLRQLRGLRQAARRGGGAAREPGQEPEPRAREDGAVDRAVPGPGQQGGDGAEPDQGAREDGGREAVRAAPGDALPVPGVRASGRGAAARRGAAQGVRGATWCSTGST
jgi:hypothetical protein